MKIMEAVKEHPYFAAGGVFLLGVVLIVIIFGGDKATATTVVASPQTDTSGATQLAMGQIAANVAVLQSNNALAASGKNDDTALALAKVNADAQNNHDLNQYNTAVGLATIQAGQAIAVSTIGANLGAHEADLQAQSDQAATAAQLAATIHGQDVSGQVMMQGQTIAGQVQSQGIAAALAATLGQQGVDARANELAAQTASGAQNTALRIADLDAQTQMALGYDAAQVAFSNNNAAINTSNNALAATKAALAAGIRKSAA